MPQGWTNIPRQKYLKRKNSIVISRDFHDDSRLLACASLRETFPNADVTLFLGGDNRDRVADALLYLLNNAPGTFGVNVALSIHHFIKIGLV